MRRKEEEEGLLHEERDPISVIIISGRDLIKVLIDLSSLTSPHTVSRHTKNIRAQMSDPGNWVFAPTQMLDIVRHEGHFRISSLGPIVSKTNHTEKN